MANNETSGAPEDFGSTFGALMAELSRKHAEFTEKHGEIQLLDEMPFPISVSEIIVQGGATTIKGDVGSLVKVRPCDKALAGRTFVGIYLGELMVDAMISRATKSGALFVQKRGNPAMFVPELRRVVWGQGSWWSFIKTPDEAKEMISDADIENVWYVQLLRAMAGTATT